MSETKQPSTDPRLKPLKWLTAAAVVTSLAAGAALVAQREETREDMQVLNRLKELARRQGSITEKIKELQAAASRKYSMLQRKMTLYNFDEDVDPNLDNHHKSSRKYA